MPKSLSGIFNIAFLIEIKLERLHIVIAIAFLLLLVGWIALQTYHFGKGGPLG
jgi:hypothetical protein